MTCVNQIYKGQFNQRFTKRQFERLCSNLETPVDIQTKFYPKNPCMWRFKVPNKWTLLLFNSGKYRIMGKEVNVQETIRFIRENVLLHCKEKQLATLQSETFIVNLSAGSPLNLYTFYGQLKDKDKRSFLYEPEIFPALQVLKWLPIFVNVFHTGRCVILGREARAQLADIVKFLTYTFVK